MRPTAITSTGLYLEPSTLCSLDCALCYTAHREQRLLDEAVIERAVALMVEGQETLGIFWCGLGEVFEDARFPSILEALDDRWPGRLLHVVQTNGQASRDLPAPANKVALISMDLPRRFQERHRGRGTWERAVAFGARHLAAGGQGVGIKCLLTRATLPAVGRSFHALQRHLSVRSGLELTETRRRSWLEPIVPFPRRDVALLDNPAFVSRGGGEDPAALLAELARHQPEHHRDLEQRPRTLELSVTARGLFSCCEAVVGIGEHADLAHLDRAAVQARLEAAAPACEACPIREVC
jgi:sulfatase maturation enzyme AslB (radical SAM superfamily)